MCGAPPPHGLATKKRQKTLINLLMLAAIFGIGLLSPTVNQGKSSDNKGGMLVSVV